MDASSVSNLGNICGLKQPKVYNPFRTIVGHTNINLIWRLKFESLIEILQGLNILLISETKIDYPFLGCSRPYHLNEAAKDESILLDVKQGIPSKRIKEIYLNKELNFFLKNGLQVVHTTHIFTNSFINFVQHWQNNNCKYNQASTYHPNCSGNNLGKAHWEYGYLIILRNFNLNVTEKHMSKFMRQSEKRNNW